MTISWSRDVIWCTTWLRLSRDGNVTSWQRLEIKLVQQRRNCLILASYNNVVMCHRNTALSRNQLFVLPITGSTSGSRHKNLHPRPDPTRLKSFTRFQTWQRPPNSCYARYSCGSNCNVVVKLVQEYRCLWINLLPFYGNSSPRTTCFLGKRALALRNSRPIAVKFGIDANIDSEDGHMTKNQNFSNPRWRTDAILKIFFSGHIRYTCAKFHHDLWRVHIQVKLLYFVDSVVGFCNSAQPKPRDRLCGFAQWWTFWGSENWKIYAYTYSRKPPFWEQFSRDLENFLAKIALQGDAPE